MFFVMRFLFVFGLGAWLCHAGACGPGLSQQRESPSVRAGVPPPSDQGGFRKLLVGDVVNGGLWFADAGCQAQFGQAGTIKSDAFDAFA